MSKGWERFFHFLDLGRHAAPSYLNPRAYAIMHRMHHAYSDTPKDPHSPVHQPNLLHDDVADEDAVRGTSRTAASRSIPRFDGGYPEWPLFDHTLSNWPVVHRLGHALHALLPRVRAALVAGRARPGPLVPRPGARRAS